jgi:hypothetical protein
VSSPSSSSAPSLENVDDNDVPSDTGDPKLWDPHAGLKLSKHNGCALDGEVKIEDNLTYGGAREVNGVMVDMMLDLGDYDKRDIEWLPPKEQRKLEARKKGSQLVEDANVKSTHQNDQERGRLITIGLMFP